MLFKHTRTLKLQSVLLNPTVRSPLSPPPPPPAESQSLKFVNVQHLARTSPFTYTSNRILGTLLQMAGPALSTTLRLIADDGND